MVLKIDLKVVMFITAILLCGMLGSELSVTAQSAGEAESPLSLPQESLTQTREPVPGGPGYVFVSPFAMIPRLSSQYYVFTGSCLQAPGNESSYLNFPVDLPHGATITRLVAYFADFDASYNMIVTLYRDNYSDFNRTAIGQAVSFGSAGYINASDTTIDLAEVDLSSYGYSIELQIPAYISGSGFMGARVDYSYPAYVPMVNN